MSTRGALKSAPARIVLAEAEKLGWTFVGLDNGKRHYKMRFSKDGDTRFIPLSFGRKSNTEARGYRQGNYVRSARQILNAPRKETP